jgi:methyltransferase family protein
MLYDNTQAVMRRLLTAFQLPTEWLNIPPGGIALDVGCGPGSVTASLARAAGPDGLALGVDISEPMLARAVSAEAEPQIGFLRADAQRLPLRDETGQRNAAFAGKLPADRPARRKGKVHREPQLWARKSISKLLHYSAVCTIQQSTGNPAYSIPSYWSSLQGGEWLKRGGQRTPAAPYPVALIRAGTNRTWICGSGSAARWPAAQAEMLAGAGALSGCSGRGRRICQGLGVSGVVIDSTPGNGVEPQWDATIGTAPGEWAVVRHA